MRGRSRRGSSGTAADFLVCFPSRTHLALMPPKPICSPSRPSASERRHSTSGRPGPPPPSSSSSSASAHYRASRNASRRQRHAMDVVGVDDEPSSPKVTCTGQIKVSRSAKPKAACAGKKPTKKSSSWIQAIGIKKDALPFLSALHGAFRLNNVAGCFRSFPGAVVEYTSGEEDEEEEEDQEERQRIEQKTEHGDALARWFMVLEEGKRIPRKKQEQKPEEEEEESQDQEDSAPANALMLMRCWSAPAKGLARRLGAGEEDEELKSAEKEEETHKETEKENLVVMRYQPDFFHVSVDIAKETWIVGGYDAVLRCRSWKK